MHNTSNFHKTTKNLSNLWRDSIVIFNQNFFGIWITIIYEIQFMNEP